jgi:hypothetical protein
LITDQMLINQQQNFSPPSQAGPALSGPSSSVGVIVPWETTP